MKKVIILLAAMTSLAVPLAVASPASAWYCGVHYGFWNAFNIGNGPEMLVTSDGSCSSDTPSNVQAQACSWDYGNAFYSSKPQCTPVKTIGGYGYVTSYYYSLWGSWGFNDRVFAYQEFWGNFTSASAPCYLESVQPKLHCYEYQDIGPVYQGYSGTFYG